MITSSNKTFKVYSGADHDWIWNDIVHDIASDITRWVKDPLTVER
jgi:hypothetical protein